MEWWWDGGGAEWRLWAQCSRPGHVWRPPCEEGEIIGVSDGHTVLGRKGCACLPFPLFTPPFPSISQMHFDSDNEGVGEVRSPVILYDPVILSAQDTCTQTHSPLTTPPSSIHMLARCATP